MRSFPAMFPQPIFKGLFALILPVPEHGLFFAKVCTPTNIQKGDDGQAAETKQFNDFSVHAIYPQKIFSNHLTTILNIDYRIQKCQ
jgi:hypothetical protein